MTLESFISTYGYPALLAGVLLEGETVVILAGLLAYNGEMSLPLVILSSFAGAFISDQTFFQIGKRKGRRLLARKAHWERRVDRVRRFLVNYQALAVFGYRFIYGMRTVTPIVIGASGFDTRRFVILNACSTLLWAAAISAAGYFFGSIVTTLLKDMRRYELPIMAVIAVAGAGLWFYRYRVKKL